MGGLGLLGALAAFSIIENPERGRFDLPPTAEELLKKAEKAK
jgi:hypothetical protein